MFKREDTHTHLYIYIPMADSCWCTPETNSILKINFPPIKNKFKKEYHILVKAIHTYIQYKTNVDNVVIETWKRLLME